MAQQMMRIDRDVGCGVILRGAVSLAVSTSQVCLSHHSFLCQCLGFLVLQNFTILTVQAHLSFYFSCCDFMDVTSIQKNVFFRALPESPKPPPLTPIRATWSFVSDVKIQDLKEIAEMWGGEGDILTT